MATKKRGAKTARTDLKMEAIPPGISFPQDGNDPINIPCPAMGTVTIPPPPTTTNTAYDAHGHGLSNRRR